MALVDDKNQHPGIQHVLSDKLSYAALCSLPFPVVYLSDEQLIDRSAINLLATPLNLAAVSIFCDDKEAENIDLALPLGRADKASN